MGPCREVIDYHLKHLLQISLVGWDDERTPPLPVPPNDSTFEGNEPVSEGLLLNKP